MQQVQEMQADKCLCAHQLAFPEPVAPLGAIFTFSSKNVRRKQLNYKKKKKKDARAMVKDAHVASAYIDKQWKSSVVKCVCCSL